MEAVEATKKIKEYSNQVAHIELKLLKVRFDISTLDRTIAFIYKDSVLRTRKTLSNIYRLMNSINPKVYEDNPNLSARYWIIKKTIGARLYEGYESSPEFLISYLKDDIECNDDIIDILDCIPDMKITHEESKYLIRKLDDALEFGYVVSAKDAMKQILDNIDECDIKSYKAIQDDLYNIATTIINIKRSVVSLGSDQTFSLQDDIL